jgi:hypothetical protein
MNRAHVHVSLSLCLALTLAVTGCSGSRQPLACQVNADCGDHSSCYLGACVIGQDPNAKIEVHVTQSELVTHRDITFDGTASTDPNPDGKVKSYLWTATRGLSAACDPSITSGSNSTFTTNFQCEGQYNVDLKVIDTLELVGHYKMTVEIAPSMNAPAITALGPDRLVVHRCEGSPLLCRAFDAADGSTAFQLSVAAHDVEDGTNLSYAWTYTPPAGVDPSKVHVTFQPGANTPTPLVQIASDGAVSGAWRFLAHATDSIGLTAVKAQTITVQNTAPTVALQGADVLLSHSYLAGVGNYIATATVQAALSDADGDPIPSATLTMSESPASSCAFQVLSSDVAGGTFTGKIELSCPGTDPQELIGVVARQLSLDVSDVNGAAANDVRPLSVTDAAPVLTWSLGGTPGIAAVPHTVVPCPGTANLCFAVDAPIPFTVSDVENDPLALRLTATGLTASGASFTPNVSSGRMSVFVPVATPAAFRGADGTSAATFTLAASDPWNLQNPVTSTFALSVGNRAPTIAAVPGTVKPAHWYSLADRAYHATFAFPPASDPDGDPLTLAAASSDGACSVSSATVGGVQVACSAPYDVTSGAPPALPTLLVPRTVTAKAVDPWNLQASTAAIPVAVQNTPPTISNQSGTLAALTTCACNQSLCEWQPQGAGLVSFDPGASDADGDPLRVTVTFASGGQAATRTCFGADCAMNFTAPDGASVTAVVSDGAFDATRTYAVVAQCSNDTTARCGPPPGKFCP